MSATSGTNAAEPVMTVLVYSNDASIRETVRLALGRRPAPDVPMIEIVEVATEPAVISRVDQGGIDVLVLDGEAQPAGGMGVCRTIKEEVFQSPPVLLLIGRAEDRWLASWTKAEAVVARPLDALEIAQAVAGLLRRRSAGAVATRG